MKNIMKILSATCFLIVGISTFPQYTQAQEIQEYELFAEMNGPCLNMMCLFSPGDECNSPGSNFKVCNEQ